MEAPMTMEYPNVTFNLDIRVDFLQSYCLKQASQSFSLLGTLTLLAFCISSSRYALHNGSSMTFTKDPKKHCSDCLSPVTGGNSVVPSHPAWYMEKPAAWSYIPDMYWDWRLLVDDPGVSFL